MKAAFELSSSHVCEKRSKCSAFDMEMIFILMQIKLFHKKDCALVIILKVRVFGTRKWPIAYMTSGIPVVRLKVHG